LNSQRLGAVAVALNLARALVTIVLRAHFDSHESRSGVLALLAGAETGRAIKAILADPSKNWSLDQLAQEAGTSRATLVRLFRKATGKTPLALLADLRLNMAHQRLLSNRGSLAEIAEEVGYGSESALSRAYSRHFGATPGAVRNRTRDVSATA
jgi:AraC family transcriptional activator of mtrCDE